jgi:hypothetical protein
MLTINSESTDIDIFSPGGHYELLNLESAELLSMERDKKRKHSAIANKVQRQRYSD